MTSHGAFLHLSAHHQSILISVCQKCGGFVGASPETPNLRIAERAHRCDQKQRKFSLAADAVRKLSRVA